MEKIKNLLSDTAVFAIGNVFTKLLLFFLMPLYTTALSTDEYGIAELLNNTVELSLPLFTLGITQAVFRYSVDLDADHKQILSAGLNILLKGFFFLVFIVCVINYFYKYEYVWYFILLYFSYSFKHLLACFTRGLGKTKIFALNGVISALCLLIFNILFLIVLKWNIHGFLLSVIISNFLGAIFLIFSARLYSFIKLSKIDGNLMKTMLCFSLPYIPNQLSWWLVNISARYFIIFYCGASIAGLFTAASKLPAMVHLLTTIFQQAWQYSSAKEYGESGSQKFFSDVFKYFSAFILVCSSGLIMMTEVISKIILKGDFYSGWTYVPLLLFSAMLGGYSIFFGTFYTASKKNRMLMISTIIGGIINILVCIFFIPVFGVTGALIASVLSYLVIVTIRIFDTKKYVTIDIRWPSLLISWTLILLQSTILMLDFPSKTDLSVVLFLLIFIIAIFSLDKEIKHIRKNISFFWQR